jgi:Overcoming lysogenization defect protein-like, TOPRIM domain
VDDETLAWLGVITEAAGGSRAALMAAAARARQTPGACTVVLVEGMSDQAAVQTLAARSGRDLPAEGVFVVPMGGATNIAHFLGLFGPCGFGVRLAGLCDQAEEHDFRRGLERAGLADGRVDQAGEHDFGRGRQRAGLADGTGTPAGDPAAGLARLGFFVCVADLEDEFIRALGAGRVERLIAAEGESGPFGTFVKQPAHRDEPREQQLHRFLGTRSGRKIRYGHLLAAAVDLALVPGPLAGLLAWM